MLKTEIKHIPIAVEIRDTGQNSTQLSVAQYYKPYNLHTDRRKISEVKAILVTLFFIWWGGT
jgi:hypothetical protein